jgi:hypothetical protein
VIVCVPDPCHSKPVEARPAQQAVSQQPGPQPASPQAAVPPPTVPDASDIRQDLALFDAVFGLPAARLPVDNSLAASAWPWLASGEEGGGRRDHARDRLGRRHPDDPHPAPVQPGKLDRSSGRRAAAILSEGAVLSIGGSPEDCFTPAEVAGLNSARQTAKNHQMASRPG